MKIYVDSFFSSFLPPDSFQLIDQVDHIPFDCDLVAVARYNADLNEHQRIIDTVLPKTKKLVMAMIETVNNDFKDFVLKNDHPNLTFLIDAELNFLSANASSITAWFMCPENFYATAPQAQALLNQLDRHTNKPFVFDCLLGTKKFHRDIIESLYQHSTCKDKILFTYFKDRPHNGQWEHALPDNLQMTGDCVDYQGWQVPLSALIPVDIYNQSYFSIVAETTALNTHNNYSEKLAKPLVAQRLFVAFAGQYYLKNLKRLGFKTFDCVIDESYDLESDAIIRFNRAWQQVEYLCGQDPMQINAEISDILNHNKQHFLSTDWQKNTKLTLGSVG